MREQEVAQRIRDRRKECGLSQHELGQRLGMSHAAVGYIERGKTRLTLDLLSRLATLLETTVSELTGGSVAEPAPHEHWWLPGGFSPGSMTITGLAIARPYQVLVCHCGTITVVQI